MTITESPAAAPARSVSGPASGAATAGLYDVVTTGDHKTLGRLYVGFAGLFFLATAVLGVVNAVEKADTESWDVCGDFTT
jgi:drug/metabolite transporter superfamily protein YnfA